MHVEHTDDEVHLTNRSGRRRSLVFTNTPEQHIIWFEEKSSRAHARAVIMLERVDQHRTRISAQLFATPRGAWRLLANDDYMRRKRHDELVEELRDVSVYFAHRRTAIR